MAIDFYQAIKCYKWQVMFMLGSITWLNSLKQPTSMQIRRYLKINEPFGKEPR